LHRFQRSQTAFDEPDFERRMQGIGDEVERVEIASELGNNSSREISPEDVSIQQPSVQRTPEDDTSESVIHCRAQVEKESETPTKSVFHAIVSTGNEVTNQNASDLSRVSFETTVQAGSLLDAKTALATVRARSEKSSELPLLGRATTLPQPTLEEGKDTASNTAVQSSDRTIEEHMNDYRTDSMHWEDRLPAADSNDEEAGLYGVAITALAVSGNEVDDARAQVVREARDAFLAETTHAEPVDPVASPKHSWEVHTVYWGLAMCLVIAIVVGVAVGVSNQKSDRPLASTPFEPVALAPTTSSPTATPIIVLEDGRIAFSTTQQLCKAVDTYLREVDSGEFSNTSNIAALHGYPIGNWDVSRITNFDRVFDPDRSQNLDPERKPTNLTKFDADLGGWDTSNAFSMKGMFAVCVKFTGQGLNRWNVSKVTDFSYMFSMAVNFNGDLSQWDTFNAINMGAMFWAAFAFDRNVSLWDVSRVTNMASMFDEASAFHGGDLTQWNVSSVVDMSYLFAAAASFTGNISTWDTRRVTDMRRTVSLLRGFHLVI
jgi:surface protein